MCVVRDPCSLSVSFPCSPPPHAAGPRRGPEQVDRPCGEHRDPSLIVGGTLLPSLLSLGPGGSPIDNNGTFTLQAHAA